MHFASFTCVPEGPTRRVSHVAGVLRACALENYDPSAGSPTETLLRLVLPLNGRVRGCSVRSEARGPAASILPSHQAIRSVVTTGGVYKGQGRIQRELMTHDYKAFHVHEHSSSARFPARRSLNGLPRPLGIGRRDLLAASV